MRHRSAIAYGIIVLALLVGAFRLETVARSNQRALCSFKHGLEDRAASTELYIEELRNGDREPLPGITIPDLRRSLNAQKDTLDSLDDLEC